jgi:outer membrane lipoprotein carrier protein
LSLAKLLALLLLPLPALAAKPAASGKAFLPQILQEVEAKYALAKTLQAEFSQVNEVASLKTKKTSNGVIAVKRPDKLRWETKAPDPNLLVSDGKKFWFYTPPFDPTEHGQVVERPSSKIQSKLANALLSGSFSVARDMKIEAEGAFKYVLTPKPGSAGTVKKAWIEINPTERLIQRVTIEHRGGNRSEITLSKIELGTDLGDDQFEFKAPAGTDKIDP